MYGGLPITVVPCAAISMKRDVPKSATFSMPPSVTSTLPGPKVAMDHALLMRMIERVADLAGVVERARRRRSCRRAR